MTPQNHEAAAGPASPRAGMLRLREMLYCSESLDALLDSVLGPNGDPALREALDAVRQGQYERAVSLLDSPPSVPPAGPQFPRLLLLARAHEGLGDLARARSAVEGTLTPGATEARWVLQVYSLLRDLGRPAEPEAQDQVAGVVAELGIGGEAAIVAGYADGEARLFWTTGGGIIGKMTDPAVIGAAAALVKAGQPFVSELPYETDHPLPGDGMVRFVLLTPGGAHSTEVKGSEVERPTHRLHPLFVAMHGLVAALRVLMEGAGHAR
jgi:hypothetical protein